VISSKFQVLSDAGTIRNQASALAAGALLIGSLFVTAACQKQSAAPAQMPPPAVTVVEVMQKDVPITGNWVATLDGYTTAQIQPQVTGYLLRQTYREGSLVHKGDVLFQIDPRPFQAALDQAKGQLAQAKAQVAQAQGQLAQGRAQLRLATINVNRDTPLAKARAIAQSQLDNDTQAKAQAEALVKTNEASIQASEAGIEASQAAVEQAELNLGFTQVHSLITGIAGIAQTQIGNLVSPTTVLTVVSQVDPIKAYFPISEQEYLHVADKLKAGGGGDWLRSSAIVPLHLTLSDGSVFPQKGKIVFADRQIDTQTGTIRIVGSFPNPRNILRPGQFGRVSAVTGIQKGALLVPQKAISELQGRNQVAVVGPDDKVSIRNVSVGPQVGTWMIVTDGLKPGERVVSEGVSKVGPGSVVKPQLENPQEASR
jgi:membrane fusion protein (multidrug efflux system)